tara:strand:- start:308 stop:508 length:201 start_codon:yes stop_codon:yes gene_type:complete
MQLKYIEKYSELINDLKYKIFELKEEIRAETFYDNLTEDLNKSYMLLDYLKERRKRKNNNERTIND